MADNSLQGGADTIRDLARQAGTIKTQVFQIDAGGATGNAEVLITAGQQTMAASLPVVLASNQPAIPVTLGSDADNTATGTLAAATNTVVLNTSAKSGASIQLTGAWVGTVTFEGTTDGTTWGGINAVAASTSTPQPTTTVNGLYRLTPGGLSQIRANMTAFTSGAVTVSMRAGSGTGGIFANQILPTKITDGVSIATIKAANTAAAATDSPLVVTLHPSTATQPITALTPLPTQSDSDQFDDDGIRYVNTNVPGADIATGDKQTAIINALLQLLTTSGVLGNIQSIAQPITVAAVNSIPLAANAAVENVGNLQRLADTMEKVLVELQAIGSSIAQLQGPQVDGAEQLRNDFNILQ